MHRSGLTDAIRAALAAGKLSPAEVTVAVRKQGLDVEEKNVRSILNQRAQIGEFAREASAGRVKFFLNPDYVPAKTGRPGGPAKSKKHAAPPVMASGLGVPVGSNSFDDAREERLLSVLETDGRLSVNDILACLPGWERSEVLRRLRELVERELVNGDMDEERRATVYWLRGSTAAARADGADVADEVPASTPVPDSTRVPTPRAAVTPRAPFGLRDRLQSVQQDIEDAITDACDAELPHAVIKALVGAGRETGRALHALAR